MKSGDKIRVSEIRMLKSEIKNKEIELKKPLTDDDVLSLIKKMVKKHKESIDLFTKGDRKDLVEKEQKELLILEPYLPKLLGGAELEKKVQDVVKEVGASSPKQMGEVMKVLTQKLGGQVDMKEASSLVRKLLSS